jgi:hypothetical protein
MGGGAPARNPGSLEASQLRESEGNLRGDSGVR